MPRWRSALGAGLLAIAACGGQVGAPSSPAQGATDSGAVNLRVKLDSLLGERQMLAAKATGAVLSGRAAEFSAYRDLLASDTTEVADVIGAALGSDARRRFEQALGRFDASLEDYAIAVAKHDQAAQSEAIGDLLAEHVPQIAALLATTMAMPQDRAVGLTRANALETKQTVDDQARRDWPAAYGDLRTAHAHAQLLGDAIASAIVSRKSANISGDPGSRGAAARVGLDQLLQEHLYLTTAATGAALGSRVNELHGVTRVLSGSSADLGRTIGAWLGGGAQASFDELWSAHDGFIVEYSTAVAMSDGARQDRALGSLTNTFVPGLAALLAGETGVSRAAVSNLIRDHVLTTKDAVDAQAGSDAGAAALKDRTAARQVEMLGDVLAAAVVRELPGKFA